MLRYDLFYLAAALLGSPLLAARLARAGRWRTDWKARFGHVAPPETGAEPSAAASPTVLVHGVSVGEVAAVRALVPALTGGGAARVVVSSTTDTGMVRARSLYGARHTVVRYPFDLSRMVRRFLNAVRPDAVALAELEVWPNFIAECTRRSIPVCVVNGRLSSSSMRGYRGVGRLMRLTFRQLSAVGAQSDLYARRFAELGVPAGRISVTGSLKWDTSGRPPGHEVAERLAALLGIDRARPLVVAGSTGPGEEEQLIRRRPPGVQLLLVPRRPERFDAVAALRPGIRRRSRCGDGMERGPDPPELFLLDTMGELEAAYRLADVAVVGRSLAPLGGSDPIPPVAAGCATLVGPHHENFADVVGALRAGGGVVVTPSPMEDAARLLGRPAARARMAERGQRVIAAHRGASLRSAGLVLDRLR